MEAVFNFRKWDPTVGGFKTVLPREKQEVLRDLSPISHVKADCPPTLLLHGDQDKLVPIQQWRDFLARLNNVGSNVTCLSQRMKDMRGHPHLMAKQKHSLDGSFSAPAGRSLSVWTGDQQSSGSNPYLTWLLLPKLAEVASSESCNDSSFAIVV